MRWAPLALGLWSATALAGDPLVDELLPKVAEAMGEPAPARVAVKRVTRAEAERVLRAGLERDVGRAQRARLGQALAAVGLWPRGLELEDAAPAFHAQNVGAFYETNERTLYLLTDQTDEAQRPNAAHELAHALQDARLELDRALRARAGSEDATLAFTAALEGQAQAVAARVMDEWLHAGAADAPRLRGLFAETAAASATLAAQSAPAPYLGLQLSFPYAAGKALVDALAARGDEVGRGLLERPPASTAQVMAPALYLEDERPLAATLPLARLLPGSTATVSTTLGRANLELLGAGLGAGWRGDRLEAAQTAQGLAVVWVVQFAQAAQGDGLAAALAPLGTVAREGATVALLSGVPAARASKVRAAALAAFRPRGPKR